MLKAKEMFIDSRDVRDFTGDSCFNRFFVSEDICCPPKWQAQSTAAGQFFHIFNADKIYMRITSYFYHR